jgi:prolyl 4-hydroxylase
VPLELQVVSLRPRAFVINHFINDYEIAEILKLAGPRMSKSIVGDGESGSFESATRTSRNGWLSRTGSDIIQTLFVRAEHLLRIPRLDSRNTEEIQVVHYKDGQKYDSHHDWGVSGFPESRYLTLLLYLSDMDGPNAGGETAFPKGADGAGFKVSPRKGSAVLFYDLLEDGNGDDLSVHAALPIWKGEKWLANFWVWDPTRK